MNRLKCTSNKATVKPPYKLWTGKKPSLKHLYIWSCPTKSRPHRPSKNKMNSKTVACYFIEYYEKSTGYKFYDLTNRSIFGTRNTRFFEDVEFAGKDVVKDFNFEGGICYYSFYCN